MSYLIEFAHLFLKKWKLRETQKSERCSRRNIIIEPEVAATKTPKNIGRNGLKTTDRENKQK